MAIGWVQSPQPSPRPRQQPQQQPQQQEPPQAQQTAAPSTSTRQGAAGGEAPEEERPQDAAAPAPGSSAAAAVPASRQERSEQPSATASDAAHAPAGSGAGSGPESNMYGESVISVPPLSISDDEEEDDEEDDEAASSHDAAGGSSSAQPVSRLDFSSVYSSFYRESPKPESQSQQSRTDHSGQSSEATTANPLVGHNEYSPYAEAQNEYNPYAEAKPPMAAPAMRPDTAHESQQRARGFSPSDSASLEEHPAFAQDTAKSSPAAAPVQLDATEVPEKLKLGSSSGGSDDEPPAGLRAADSWHISAEKDGRGMHVTFQASGSPDLAWVPLSPRLLYVCCVI